MKKFLKATSLFLLVMLLISCNNKTENVSKNSNTTSNETSNETNSEEKSTALDFPIEFTNINGDIENIEDYKGKITILNFWQTTCYYCKEEMPEFIELQNENDDLNIIYVSVYENTEKVENFLKEHNFNIEPKFDLKGELAQNFGVTGFPTNAYFDADGNFLGTIPGYIGKDMVEEILQKIRNG